MQLPIRLQLTQTSIRARRAHKRARKRARTVVFAATCAHCAGSAALKAAIKNITKCLVPNTHIGDMAVAICMTQFIFIITLTLARSLPSSRARITSFETLLFFPCLGSPSHASLGGAQSFAALVCHQFELVSACERATVCVRIFGSRNKKEFVIESTAGEDGNVLKKPA